MKRMLPRNKNGEGRTCKNRVSLYLDDEQNTFLNKLSIDLKMSKADVFRWLLRKEYEIDNGLIEEEFDVIL